jgi:hypothetical protein
MGRASTVVIAVTYNETSSETEESKARHREGEEEAR